MRVGVRERWRVGGVGSELPQTCCSGCTLSALTDSAPVGVGVLRRSVVAYGDMACESACILMEQGFFAHKLPLVSSDQQTHTECTEKMKRWFPAPLRQATPASTNLIMTDGDSIMTESKHAHVPVSFLASAPFSAVAFLTMVSVSPLAPCRLGTAASSVSTSCAILAGCVRVPRTRGSVIA